MGKSRTGRSRRARLNMMTSDPHCWYCRVKVVETPNGEPRQPDSATVEHLFSRLHGRRPPQGMLVLACQQCNHERNQYSERLLGSDALHQRAHPSRMSDDQPCDS